MGRALVCDFCAKTPLFTGDDLWYRAIVLEASDSGVKVLYADYGNMETLPLSRVQPIPASHLQPPFQIIRCSLEGEYTALLLSGFVLWNFYLDIS